MRSALLSATAMPISFWAGIATAQTAPRPSSDIVVTARRADSARNEQKQAPNLVNIQPAETIAKYPDVNAAEALSRIPGVALSIDTGEGRFVNIRGLDGNLNGATFGGVVLLNTQPGGTYFNATGRAVEFDTVPIGAIDRIVVTKTGMPDHDAEGLGGSIELSPRTAIGRNKLFVEATFGGGLETRQKTGLYRDEIVLGGPLGGTNAQGKPVLSFVLTQFLYNDRRSFDDIEAAYADNQPTTPDKAFAGLELRKYAYNRKRFGYSGELDFTPDDESRVYFRTSMAGYNESAQRNRLEIDGLDTVVPDPANSNGFIAPDASTVKTLRHYDETHRNIVAQLGGDHKFVGARFDWFAAFSQASYRKHYDYNTTFDGPAGLTLAYDNTTDPDYPAFRVVSGASITDSANYTLKKIGNAPESDRDREWSAAANLAVPLNLGTDDEFKVGVKVRFRHKVATPLGTTFVYTGTPKGLGDFSTDQTVNDFYGRYAIGALLDPTKIETFLAANASGGGQPGAAPPLFDDNEDVISGYGQYKATFGDLGILAGLRVEQTRAVYRGTRTVTDANGADISTPASRSKTYTNLFPTVQLRYSLAPDLVARGTWSTGIARPGFFQTIQSLSVDVGGGTVSTGNPNLRPITGNNFDLSLEYYLPGNGVLSVGVFDKEFRNYIVARTLRGTYPGITGIATISTYSNVSGARARGIEAALDYKFSGLPGLLSGFGVEANGSYVDSSARIRDGEATVALPGTFKYTANGALFFEKYGLQMRLSGQYESAVLFGVGGSRATDIFQDKRFTLDFNGSYKVTPRVSLYANAKNLTNAPLRFYEGAGNRPIQREYYNLSLEGGIKISL
ncbi:MAG: TonB-dependent receptor [Sphingomonas sp.]|nr:TonB-dependent receptor [Sphingomonas sp.]